MDQDLLIYNHVWGMADGSQLGIIKLEWKNVDGAEPRDVVEWGRYSCLGQGPSILLLSVCII